MSVVSVFETVRLEIEVNPNSLRISAVAIDGEDLPMSDELRATIVRVFGNENFEAAVEQAHDRSIIVDACSAAKAETDLKLESA